MSFCQLELNMKHVRVFVTKEKSLIQREGVLSKDVWCKDEEN